MEAGPRTVKVVFEQDRRLLVPLFQRPYVWNQTEQWEPLWNDIRGLAQRLLDGKDVRPHFLGAVVLDQILKATGQTETRIIIDGQQRLTTLQLFLEAFADLCKHLGDEKHYQALVKLTRNSDPLSSDPDEDFKVWPTNVDREHFRRVMEGASPKDVLKGYGKKPDAASAGRPIADAYIYFYRSLEEWLGAEDHDSAQRIATLYKAIRENLQMVVIDLGKDDDAQVIFETLNARGTPLLPSDLVKNHLFREIQKEGHSPDPLYTKYWRPFEEEDDFWREQVGRGHARRARIDLFLQFYLTLKRADEIPVAHLYSAFRDFVRGGELGPTHYLKELHSYGRVFRSFSQHLPDSSTGRFFARLEAMDVGTAYPFLLECFRIHEDDADLISNILQTLESWLVRRMVCQLNTRGYNRLFIELLKVLPGPSTSLVRRIRDFLMSSDADSNRWPSDKEFNRAWRSVPVYQALVRERVRMVLEALELALRSTKTEKVSLQEKLTIEHLLPQEWEQHWPLPDGLNEDRARDERHTALHTIGNLTLVTKKLNPSLSNGPWKKKRPELKKHTVLKLNALLVDVPEWDESAIRERADEMFEVARRIWPLGK